MSIAVLNDYRSVANTQAPTSTATSTPAVTAVPTETEARGFALYVGIDEAAAAAAGVSLAQLVQALRKTVAELVPASANETYAAVALAPKGIGGKNIDVVRTALHDPRSLNRLVEANKEDAAAKGIVIDITRHRVFADGQNAELTFKEFELLNYLIQNQGETITRRELIDAVWADELDEAPNERTVDVHVRRLRAKIAGYEDVIRTVRGGGYRFDKHPDVLVEA
jgi:DNA-binding winged helix-turn-helix (wHTH) protein